MMKFRKKPVIVEAFQFKGPTVQITQPDWAVKAINDNRIIYHFEYLKIVTLEGDMYAKAGDWIIKGIKGELYICQPDIFELTYEQVTEAKKK